MMMMTIRQCSERIELVSEKSRLRLPSIHCVIRGFGYRAKQQLYAED